MNCIAGHLTRYLIGAAAGALVTVLVAGYWMPAADVTVSRDTARPHRDNATTPTQAAPTPGHPGDSTHLIQQQQQQISSLQQQVEWLQSVLEQLDGAPEQAAETSPPPGREIWFDGAALKSIGMDEQDIANLKHRVEQQELAKLELLNRAAREGWDHSSKLFKQLRKLTEQFRQSLTSDEYDKVLYATGRNNRVKVTDTLENSPAGNAGIHKGDRIISYDGKRIFDPVTLVRSTTQGDIGEMVPVVLQRGEDRLTVYVPRGSLGLRIAQARAAPDLR